MLLPIPPRLCRRSAVRKVILITASGGKTVAATFKGLRPGGVSIDVGVGPEPIEVTSTDLIFGERKVAGSLTGNPATGDATLRFSALSGVSAMIETVPLEQAPAAYAKMMAGKARFRMVLVTRNGRLCAEGCSAEVINSGNNRSRAGEGEEDVDASKPRTANFKQHPLNLRAKRPALRICSTNRRLTSLLMRQRPTSGELTSSIGLSACSRRTMSVLRTRRARTSRRRSQENVFEVSATIATSRIREVSAQGMDEAGRSSSSEVPRCVRT